MIDHESIAEGIAAGYRKHGEEEGTPKPKKGFHGKALKAAFESNDHEAIEELIRHIANNHEPDGDE